MEKPAGQPTVTVVDTQSEEPDIQPVTAWTPGYLKRFPIVGALSLGSIVLLAGAALGVLIGSDNVSEITWPQKIAPNVVLSLLHAFSSLSIAVAVGEGVAIAWWRKALKGSTVAQLHEQWTLTSGLFKWGAYQPKALTSSIALAVLATQVALLNSILYQRATSTYVAHDTPRTLQAVGIGATEFPMTGYVVSNTSVGAQTNCACFMVGDQFTPVVNAWETSNGFYPGYNEYFRFSKQGGSGGLQYCNGLCYTTLDAIGFEIDCVDSTNHVDIAIPAIAAYNANGDPSAYTNLPIFNSSFLLEYATSARNYSQITLNLQYFQSDDPYNPKSTSCPGTVFTKQCSLRPAIVRYPVSVTNFTNIHIANGVSLGTQNMTTLYQSKINAATPAPKYDAGLRQANGYQVISYLYPNDTHTIRSLTALGGIANAMSQFLSSTAAITYTGNEDWSLQQVGTLSQTMMYGPPNMGSCDCSFKATALDIIVNEINQLAFVTATGMVDYSSFYGLPTKQQNFPSTLPQAVVMGVDQNDTTSFRASADTATQITDVVFYQTHYLFAGLSFGITMACILLVIPSFWHYGQLGRRVTLGPMEIASAFGAPILVDNSHTEAESGQTESDINALIKNIGGRKIVYGFVDVDNEGHGGHQEMHLQPHNTTDAMGQQQQQQQQHQQVQSPVSPISPVSPQISGVASPPMSPMIGGDESKIQKRKSVRLAMGNPEAVRPASTIVPLARIGMLKE